MDYYQYLVAELAHRGYTGDFCPKTMGAMEGGATFYKKSHFKCVDTHQFSFNEMLREECEKRNVNYEKLECERDHVFLVTKLCHSGSNKIVTVGNIHTIWDNFSQLDVTTLQVALALNRLGLNL